MRFLLQIILTLCASSSLAAELPSGGLTIVDPVVRESKVMGQPLRVEQDGETVSSGLGVVSSTHTQFLGHSMTLMEASVEAIPSAEVTTAPAVTSHVETLHAVDGVIKAAATPAPIILGETNVYIDGIKLWTGTLQYANGSLSYSGGVPPTQIPFTIFVYPVGPMTLQVDAGVEFEGELDASVTPGLSYPLSDSTLDAKVSGNVGAGGFIEGYANLWLIRAGVGGAVDLIDGSIGVAGHLYLSGQAPTGAGFGIVHLLSGDLYGFVDTKFFFGRWNRILKKEFYSWNGWCYSFGATSCGIQ